MSDGQLLRPGPLSQEDAMAVLWRRGKGTRRNLDDDTQVFRDVEKLKDENWGEYGALAELAGVDKNRGFGSLPLALVQVGSFIRSTGMPFGGYVGMYQGSGRTCRMC